MIIINDKFAIDSDSRCWKICKHQGATEKSPEAWSAFKYYPSLQSAYDALREILLRTSEYDSFADLDRNLRQINKLLDKKLKVSI